MHNLISYELEDDYNLPFEKLLTRHCWFESVAVLLSHVLIFFIILLLVPCGCGCYLRLMAAIFDYFSLPQPDSLPSGSEEHQVPIYHPQPVVTLQPNSKNRKSNMFIKYGSYN